MGKRIRVLRVQHNFVEPTNHKFLEELSKFEELEVHALCPEWGIESGNMRRLDKSPLPNLKIGKTVFTKHYATTAFTSAFGSMIRRLKPDILSIHEEAYALTMGQAVAFRAMHCPESRLIFCSAQNIFKNYPPPFAQIERATYRAAAAGYGCCEGVMEVARRKGYDGIFDIIPLGMDPDLFTFRRREGSIKGRPFVVGFVGQMTEEKGVFDLLRAFLLLKGDVELRYLGNGGITEKLRRLAREAGAADRVKLLGPAPHREVPKTMDTFDLLVVPSHTTPTWKEQFGRVIPEAYSIGVPVIGSDSGSIPEVVGDPSMIFREKDHEQLARMLQDFVDNPQRLPELSYKVRSAAEEKFSWKKVAAMNRKLFHKVIEKSGL